MCHLDQHSLQRHAKFGMWLYTPGMPKVLKEMACNMLAFLAGQVYKRDPPVSRLYKWVTHPQGTRGGWGALD